MTDRLPGPPHTFRLNVGLSSSSSAMGGWESPTTELRGHSMGHLLSALAQAYASTGTTAFRTKGDYLVAQLATCQSRAENMLDTEFGGMNEVLTNLYQLTNDPNHLTTAQCFDHAEVFDPLASNVDALNNYHANTQIPKMVGAIREYHATGTTRYRDIAFNFWNSGSGTARFAITTSGAGGEQRINAPAALPTGAWTHVAVAHSGGGVGVLYVDGSEVARNAAMTLPPGALGTTTQNWIGRSQYADPYLDGAVDSLRIYSRALSASEVSTLYTSGL